MSTETEDDDNEFAIAMAFAVSERSRESKNTHMPVGNLWHRSADTKIPIGWHKTEGWKKTSMLESTRGRRS